MVQAMRTPTPTTAPGATPAAVEIRLLGGVSVRRAGLPVDLPRSRKVRALLALLALERTPLSRTRLCDLLWDVPNDPRGELRWCLSKLRSVLDDADRKRVVTGSSEVALDLEDAFVDALEIERAAARGLTEASEAELDRVAALFAGDLLEGLELDASPELSLWLTSQRRRFAGLRVAVLETWAMRDATGQDGAERFRRLEAWLAHAPFEVRAHAALLAALASAGRLREAEAHVLRTIRAFEDEGLDWGPLRAAWPASRAQITSAPPLPPEVLAPGARRARVAVMPFEEPEGSALGRGLTDDVITRLAKLRVLFVIARGTSFALQERGATVSEAGRILEVDYVVGGRVRRRGPRLTVLAELSEARTGHIVWSDELDRTFDDTFSVLDTVVDRIVARVAEEIETEETRRALQKPPSSLDAWEAYHRGLFHMYKFSGPENARAEHLFRTAITLDPLFARAHAGLSFTHFQNVFLGLTEDRDRQVALAAETAARSLEADDRDPAAHWAMGRALWLGGALRESILELEQSVELSPNFALGHYMLGFVRAQSGDPAASLAATNTSRELSPFDPLQFGMLASRALAHLRLGEFDEATEWAVRAATRPNAHVHILAIAATCLALAKRREEAREVIGRIRAKLPAYTVEDFLRAFRFAPEAEELFRHVADELRFGPTPRSAATHGAARALHRRRP